VKAVYERKCQIDSVDVGCDKFGMKLIREQ